MVLVHAKRRVTGHGARLVAVPVGVLLLAGSFVLGRATAGGPSAIATRPHAPTAHAAPPAAPSIVKRVLLPMPVVTRGLPAYAEGNALYPPGKGDDDMYGPGSGAFLCAAPCSLIIDLSTVPQAKRQKVLVAWYNDETLYDAAAIGSPFYNEPRDYTIDVASAPAGTTPPTTWTTLVNVTGNFYNGREHVVDLKAANWLRMHVTAVNGSPENDDASFNLDVHDASASADDSWLTLGDSIAQDDMGHYEPGNFMQQVNAAHPAFFPSQINGGIGGWDAGSPLKVDRATGHSYIDEFLASFPGHFVSLDFGTNDANEGGAALADFSAEMTTMVQKVIAAGKVPVLRRSIPYGCTAEIEANGPTVNRELVRLLAAFPQAVAGPDEWPYFETHRSLLSSDCIHPTLPAGALAYRQVYVAALLSTVYADASPLG